MSVGIKALKVPWKQTASTCPQTTCPDRCLSMCGICRVQRRSSHTDLGSVPAFGSPPAKTAREDVCHRATVCCRGLHRANLHTVYTLPVKLKQPAPPCVAEQVRGSGHPPQAKRETCNNRDLLTSVKTAHQTESRVISIKIELHGE